MKSFATTAALALVLVLLPAAASAHPGHGVLPPGSPGHYLFEMPHALWIVALAAVVGTVQLLRLAVRWRRRRG